MDEQHTPTTSHAQHVCQQSHHPCHHNHFIEAVATVSALVSAVAALLAALTTCAGPHLG